MKGNAVVIYDHLGSTSLVVDAQGNEIGYVIYDAYGRLVENTIPVTLTGRLFTGQVFDASTGLYYYNARYYDPLTGQFTQPDSLIPDPMNPAAWNRFSYVYGNPVNYTDPSGHVAIAPWDLLDIVSFGASLSDFIQEPSLANAGWLALDTLGLLPIFPALGAIHHAGKLDDVGDVGRFIPPGGSGGGGYDPLEKFVKERLGTAPQNINCYGCVFKEWPEVQGNPALIDDLFPNPWGNDFEGMYNFAMGYPNADQVENAIRSNFDKINLTDLSRGDLISWQGIEKINFGFGHGPQDYQYITHVGLYLGDNKVFGKMGYQGAYEIRFLDDSFLAQYGTMSYWRAR